MPPERSRSRGVAEAGTGQVMPPEPLVLVAHGSRDARAARSTHALARAVGAARPDARVATAFLDFEAPGLAAALRQEASNGHHTATVVPLLLTAAYHGRVDVPGVLRTVSELRVGLAPVLGPVGGRQADEVALSLLVRALGRRLAEASADPLDGVVLAAAGTSHVDALTSVDLVADALGATLGVPCVAGYASGAGRSTAQAVAVLRARGAERIAVAAYFLAPGLLYDRATASALTAGAHVVAAPLGDAPEVAELVLRRADAAA